MGRIRRIALGAVAGTILGLALVWIAARVIPRGPLHCPEGSRRIDPPPSSGARPLLGCRMNVPHTRDGAVIVGFYEVDHAREMAPVILSAAAKQLNPRAPDAPLTEARKDPGSLLMLSRNVDFPEQ